MVLAVHLLFLMKSVVQNEEKVPPKQPVEATIAEKHCRELRKYVKSSKDGKISFKTGNQRKMNVLFIPDVSPGSNSLVTSWRLFQQTPAGIFDTVKKIVAGLSGGCLMNGIVNFVRALKRIDLNACKEGNVAAGGVCVWGGITALHEP